MARCARFCPRLMSTGLLAPQQNWSEAQGLPSRTAYPTYNRQFTSIPSERRYVKFGEWAKEYGPVYSLMLGTQVYVVLSADYAVRDLVDKRGPIYASRPDLYVAQHLISGGLRILSNSGTMD